MLTGAHVAGIAGGRVVFGDRTESIGRVSIDTRTLLRGDFFVAIRGERHDGHKFVTDALARGALGAMVDEAPAAPLAGAGRPAPLIVQVADTVRALQDVARDVRRRAGSPLVAITGSAGKTTTKEVAAELLAARFRVFRNRGNLNNHIGLPLSLLELRARPEIAVVEFGMNHPGEIRALVGVAEPDVRVWTNVGDAHLGFFSSAEEMADAKAEILELAKPSDVLIANANDPRVQTRTRLFRGRVVTFGIDVPCDVQATRVEHRGLDGTAAHLKTPGGESEIATPLLGLGNLANVLAASAVALHFGVPLEAIVARAATLRAAPHRGELLRLPGGITLVDDSYNSSPAALTRALETIAAATGSARKVAVLGEMLELGAHGLALHEACGRAAAAAGVDVLIAVGGTAAAALAHAAGGAGLAPSNVVYVRTNQEAADAALQRVRPGDLVLVKGSRGIGTDFVVERLKAEFA